VGRAKDIIDPAYLPGHLSVLQYSPSSGSPEHALSGYLSASFR
jgi:hypothetical protein